MGLWVEAIILGGTFDRKIQGERERQKIIMTPGFSFEKPGKFKFYLKKNRRRTGFRIEAGNQVGLGHVVLICW